MNKTSISSDEVFTISSKDWIFLRIGVVGMEKTMVRRPTRVTSPWFSQKHKLKRLWRRTIWMKQRSINPSSRLTLMILKNSMNWCLKWKSTRRSGIFTATSLRRKKSPKIKCRPRPPSNKASTVTCSSTRENWRWGRLPDSARAWTSSTSNWFRCWIPVTWAYLRATTSTYERASEQTNERIFGKTVPNSGWVRYIVW